MKSIESKPENIDIHFVYAGEYYFYPEPEIIGIRLESLILKVMKKNKIKRAMVTKINMGRVQIIQKEKMDNYMNETENPEDSVNDDIDSLFEDIRLGKEPPEHVDTYFLPKLMKEQVKLLQIEDESFMETLNNKTVADVDKAEMTASESDSKFVWEVCERTTFTIENSSKRKISSH